MQNVSYEVQTMIKFANLSLVKAPTKNEKPGKKSSLVAR